MKNKLFLLLLLPIFSVSCEKLENVDIGPYKAIDPDNPVNKGNRMFGVNLSESKFGFDFSYDKLKEIGTDMIELNIPWNAIETSKGKYNDPYGGVLKLISVYADDGIKICLSLAVINTVDWEIPKYLDGIETNSEEFIAAFNNMIDWIMVNKADNADIFSISIGNEVDYVLKTTKDWENYTAFYRAASAHIHSKYPEVTVGVKITVVNGLFDDSNKAHTLSINQYSDVVMLNYYPQNEKYQVKEPEAIHSGFDKIVSIFPDKVIWLTEIGYQSGHKYCLSTETKQAHFYHEMFKAWDKHKDNIQFVLVDWLHDQSSETINEWKDYYGNDPALVEYLSTLGLRKYDGTEKPAWKQVKIETEARGWH